jgi:hypothetical protein
MHCWSLNILFTAMRIRTIKLRKPLRGLTSVEKQAQKKGRASGTELRECCVPLAR